MKIPASFKLIIQVKKKKYSLQTATKVIMRKSGFSSKKGTKFEVSMIF